MPHAYLMLAAHPSPSAMAIPLREDGWILAHAPGVGKAELAAFRQGKRRPAARLDLHGKKAAEVASALGTFIQDAQLRGLGTVLVIFGRGNHSIGGGVLRDVTYDLVVSGSIAGVLAIASARPADGGLGAAYLWVGPT